MVAVGKIGTLFGSDGGVSVVLYSRDAINMEEPVFVNIDELWVPLFVSSFRSRGQRGATVVFEDVDSSRRAEELLGLELFVEGGEEDSSEDFVGWGVDLGDGLVGEVAGFIDGENALFEVAVAESGEWVRNTFSTILIPAALVVEVDEGRRTIVFEIPDGLLDLNG